ncbi:cation:proton antiporter [Natrinema sp. 74]|uniref:cation:proton antiporter n=1 Tax=Natrinema sp. 74 TaxID=3384159 RepID=UPI0038D40321
MATATYAAILIVVGLAVLGAVVLPRLVADKPMSFPMVYVVSGMVLFSLPLGVEIPNPVTHPHLTERLTELVVIIALMGSGLKLDRPFDPRAWSITWRLLGVVMPLTIVVTALLGWWLIGTLSATAILLGAVVAPTDPVLASDVGASPPTEETETGIDPKKQEDEVRFALTSEAGLNDGLAFPFTNLAIAAAAVTGTGSVAWLGEWMLVDVGYKILVGTVAGYVSGQAMARLIFGAPSTTELAEVMQGAEALAATLITYGVTELVGGYGFIAVFVAALELRHYEWEHEYYEHLHEFTVTVERLLMAVVLVTFGGAVAGGLLAPLSPLEIGVGLAIVLVVRPVAGLIGLLGAPLPWAERAVIATFGVRGIGSFYYLSYAMNEASVTELELLVAEEQLWAIVGFVVLASVFVHGVVADPVMNLLERTQSERTSADAAELPSD